MLTYGDDITTGLVYAIVQLAFILFSFIKTNAELSIKKCPLATFDQHLI